MAVTVPLVLHGYVQSHKQCPSPPVMPCLQYVPCTYLANASLSFLHPSRVMARVSTMPSPWLTTLCSRWHTHLPQSAMFPPSLNLSRVILPASAHRTLLPASVTNVGSQPTRLYFFSSCRARPTTTAT